MKNALVDPRSGRIVQIVGIGQDFPVATPLFWVNTADTVTEAHTWDGTQIVAPPAPQLTDEKKRTILALSGLAETKFRLGFVYNTKTYQCDGPHLANMKDFILAYTYFTTTKPLWATLTVYGLGDIVIQAKVFYKCAEAHTAGVFATDLAAAKWVAWYFHPKMGGDGKWRDKANAMNALTTEQARAMCEGAINYAASVRAQAVVHKDGINACATEADRLTYETQTMPTGWPANT